MAFDPGQLRFLQRLVKVKPERTAMSNVAAWFSEHHAVGTLFARHIEYRSQHHAIAEQLLRAHELPVAALPSNASRADAAMYAGMSEKTQSRPPMSDGVAMKTLGGRVNVAGWQGGGLAGAYLVGTIAHACAVEADRVMVVENLETFRWLEDYRWLRPGELRILVLYRGDRDMALRDAMAVLEARTDPVWAFFDFDPAGLGMANALPRLERIVLPGQEWLTGAAKGARSVALFESSRAQYERQLDRAKQAAVASAWDLLKSLRGGVSQEAMRDAES
jgi:hypothetical protein